MFDCAVDGSGLKLLMAAIPVAGANRYRAAASLVKLSWGILVLLAIPLLVIGYVACVAARAYLRSRPSRRSRRSAPAPYQFDPATARDPLDAIRRRDAAFDEQVFLRGACAAFERVQRAWQKRSLDDCQQTLSEKMLASLEAHLDDMKFKGQRNIMDNISIENARVVMASASDTTDRITVLFDVTMVDYIIDERTGRLLEGTMRARPRRENWTFARLCVPDRSEASGWRLESIDAVAAASVGTTD